MTEQEVQIAAGAMKGDVNAFTGLYTAFSKKWYTFALYMLGSSHDAEDIVSEAVLDAWKGIGTLKEAAAFEGWMYTILKNKCLMKRKQYATDLSESVNEIPESGMDAGISETERTEQGIDLINAMKSLSYDERFIILMNIVGGFSLVQIADDLMMPEATVRSKKSRALGKLKKCLSVEERYE